MGIELVVLDFDGTVTEIKKEGKPFTSGYKDDVSAALDMELLEFRKKWKAAQRKVRRNPVEYGWEIDGIMVTHALVDPIIYTQTVAGVVMDDAGFLLDQEERKAFLKKIFEDNYPKTGAFFRQGVDDFLHIVKSAFDLCIVTNSRTNHVVDKIKELPSDHSDIPIYGNALKFIPTPDWTEVPEYVEDNGFIRPVFLRRKRYWDVLQKIMDKRNLISEQVAVVGDIYEMDLALPEYKGMNIILAPNSMTPDFEIETVNASPLGYVAKDLDAVIGHLETVK